MNTCEKCPLVSNDCFHCEYCSKPPTSTNSIIKTNPDLTDDEVNRLVIALINRECSFTNLQHFTLMRLSRLINHEISRRKKVRRIAYQKNLKAKRMAKRKLMELRKPQNDAKTESSE